MRREILLLCISISSFAFGLKCHTCMYVKGMTGDVRCKDANYLTATKTTLRGCVNEKDAINAREMVVIKLMSNSTKFIFGCLKTVLKTEEVDIVIRGCYGHEKEPDACETPSPYFWKQLKEGPLRNTTRVLDITNAKFEVCVCGTEDGCNSSNYLYSRPNIQLGLALIARMLLV